MGNNDTAMAIAVGMRVFFGRPAVRCPACVSQTELTLYGLFGKKLFEVLQFTG